MKIFVNLPVRDLKRSMEFWRKLGFDFDEKYTDDKAACLVISEEAYVMLLTEPFFKRFTRRELWDPARQTEGIFALMCQSRAEVDDLLAKSVSAGGSRATETSEQPMYSASFYDLDGHHWEIFSA